MELNLGYTATFLEWAYAVTGLAGYLICGFLTAWHYRNRLAIADIPANTDDVVLARGLVFDAAVNASISLVVFGLGWAAMLTPPASAATPITRTGVVFAIGLEYIAVAGTVKALLEFFRLGALQRADKKAHAKEQRDREGIGE